MQHPYIARVIQYLDRIKYQMHKGYTSAAMQIAAHVDGLLQKYQTLNHERERLLDLQFANQQEADGIIKKIRDGVVNYARQLYKPLETKTEHPPAPHHAVATAVILILAVIGLASFFLVSEETTARVVSPAVANIPLGVTFLAILVIAIIAMPHRRIV